MPRLKVTATCTATVTEEWIVDITADEYALLVADEATQSLPSLRADLIEVGTYVNVENAHVEGEYDREVTGFELVADDFTNAVDTVGIAS